MRADTDFGEKPPPAGGNLLVEEPEYKSRRHFLAVLEKELPCSGAAVA